MTRVLVIDDEPPIRLLCRVNLEAEGMEVLEASDGPTGLEKARNDEPDVILLDVMMPGLDGWQVAEELIDGERTNAIPIVFLTARAEARDRARGLDLGGIDYVTKPFNPVELAPLVRELIDARRPRRARRPAPREARRAARPVRPTAPRLAAGEVGRHHQRVAVPGEAPAQRADPDDAVARVQQVRAVLGAREPQPQDRAGGAQAALAPRQVLADPPCADA